MFAVNQVHWLDGKRETPQNTELDSFIGISFLVMRGQSTKRMLRLVLDHHGPHFHVIF